MIKAFFYLQLKHVPIVCLLFMPAIQIFAQIGGISGSKISAICVDVVDDKHIEFEPAFGFSKGKKYWDNSGHQNSMYVTQDSSMNSSELAFRLTYGLWDCLEFGGAISSDLSRSNLGMKYILFQNNLMGMAAMSGISLPMENGIRSSMLNSAEHTSSAGAGIVMTVYPTESLCLDLNIQGHSFLKETQEGSRFSYYINADAGYYLFSEQLQLVAGIGYSQMDSRIYNQSLLTVYPGITLETGDQHIVVISCPFDVWGRNSVKSAGVSVALTLTFN